MIKRSQALSIARASLDQMYLMLKAPSGDERWWETLNRAEKETLMRHAGLKHAFRNKSWNKFSKRQQKEILDSAIRASKWAQKVLSVIQESRRNAQANT